MDYPAALFYQEKELAYILVTMQLGEHVGARGGQYPQGPYVHQHYTSLAH